MAVIQQVELHDDRIHEGLVLNTEIFSNFVGSLNQLFHVKFLRCKHEFEPLAQVLLQAKSPN